MRLRTQKLAHAGSTFFFILGVVGCTCEITLRKMGGFLKTPTPGGVPVRNTSPGANVTNLTGEENTQYRPTFRSRREHLL